MHADAEPQVRSSAWVGAWEAALTLAHRAYVLESGRIAAEGAAADLLRDPHVRRAYLGPLAVSRA